MDAEAMRAEPEAGRYMTQPRLYSGIGWLDSMVGGFRPGEVVLLDSPSQFLDGLLSEICVQAVTEFGHELVFIDGGNSIRPYEIARICKFRDTDPNQVLSRIRVARGFTAHQMASLLNDGLEPALRSGGASTVIVSCFLDLFQDPDMRWNESLQLVNRSLDGLQRLTRQLETVTVISNRGTQSAFRRRALARALESIPDRTVRMTPTGTGMLVSLPRYGEFFHRYPVPRGQTILERYDRGCGFGEDRRHI